jgi:transcriptional regulator with XRE-family HTH domain
MKVKTDDPIICGKRIKTARLLAGLSRKDMEDNYSICASTLQAWEIGKNPLNEKGARRLIDVFNKINLFCSVEWLLYGIGNPPKPFTAMQFNKSISDSHPLMNWDDELSIQKEIDIFYKVNNNAVVLLDHDDGMSPIYAIGDYVAGKKRYENQINTVVGKHCIVQLQDQSTFVRYLKNSTKDGLFNLFCTNANTAVQVPVMGDVSLVFAAPIIWHRKCDR